MANQSFRVDFLLGTADSSSRWALVQHREARRSYGLRPDSMDGPSFAGQALSRRQTTMRLLAILLNVRHPLLGSLEGNKWYDQAVPHGQKNYLSLIWKRVAGNFQEMEEFLRLICDSLRRVLFGIMTCILCLPIKSSNSGAGIANAAGLKFRVSNQSL